MSRAQGKLASFHLSHPEAITAGLKVPILSISVSSVHFEQTAAKLHCPDFNLKRWTFT